ncbi:hypothetical protein AHAS_Ahas15G0267400 [Arachis hypogaea]
MSSLIPFLYGVHMKNWWHVNRKNFTYCCWQQEALLDEQNECSLEFHLIFRFIHTHLNQRPCQK